MPDSLPTRTRLALPVSLLLLALAVVVLVHGGWIALHDVGFTQRRLHRPPSGGSGVVGVLLAASGLGAALTSRTSRGALGLLLLAVTAGLVTFWLVAPGYGVELDLWSTPQLLIELLLVATGVSLLASAGPPTPTGSPRRLLQRPAVRVASYVALGVVVGVVLGVAGLAYDVLSCSGDCWLTGLTGIILAFVGMGAVTVGAAVAETVVFLRGRGRPGPSDPQRSVVR